MSLSCATPRHGSPAHTSGASAETFAGKGPARQPRPERARSRSPNGPVPLGELVGPCRRAVIPTTPCSFAEPGSKLRMSRGSISERTFLVYYFGFGFFEGPRPLGFGPEPSRRFFGYAETAMCRCASDGLRRMGWLHDAHEERCSPSTQSGPAQVPGLCFGRYPPHERRRQNRRDSVRQRNRTGRAWTGDGSAT
jgi:hypothetical protein